METPGRLSTTASTLVIGDCWATIGSATTLVAKLRGSSATTVMDSMTRLISRITWSRVTSSGWTEADSLRVSKPERVASTR